MLDKVSKLYNLIFDQFKFELEDDTLCVSPPKQINDQYMVSAKQFISNNKSFIVSVLKKNLSSKDILHFDLSDGDIPLSFAQERLWFVDKYEGGTNAYNIPLVFKLSKAKPDILEKSIRSIASRHEILRTIIKEDSEGGGYQSILDDVEYPIEIKKTVVADLVQLNQELYKTANYIFDLSKEYPIRVWFYELKGEGSQAERYLNVVIHHIAFDGWSVDIFLKELQAYYNYYLEQSEGLEANLSISNLNIQYKDFALWQRSYLNEERLEKQLNYWKNKLNGYEVLNLITDKSRPNQIDYRGKDIYFELDEGTSKGLRELAKEFKVSLFSLLLSGYYLMLKSYSNQEDIIVGTTMANRHYSQVENLIGFFVNSLALRTKLDTKDSVKEFIQKVGAEVVEAQLYQDLPFEKLVEELKVAKDTSRHPIFQVMFIVQDFGRALQGQRRNGAEDGLTKLLQPYMTEEGLYNIAKFDMSTFVDSSQDKLKGNFNYAVSLYTETTINGFIETYKVILKQLAELTNNSKKEQIRLCNLNYLNQEQYNQLIYNWNQTDEDFPREKVVHQLFEEQVVRTPNNIAVVYEDSKLTYQELNERANQLAYYLCKKGVNRGTIVAICIDRSIELVVVLLGILKAGGVYLSLDTSYPDERLEFILKDTGAPLLITRLDIISRCINFSGEFINIAHIPEKIAVENSTNLTQFNSKFDLVYIMYTSGSTGNPKGVGNTHEGIVNRLLWTLSAYPIFEGDKLLQIASIGFDISVWEMMFPLLKGGSLIIGDVEKSKDVQYLISTIEKHRVTVMHFVPSLLRVFLDEVSSDKCESIKQVVCGGEGISIDLKDKFFKKFASKLYHAYGPTEASISVTHWDCDNERFPDKVPIGSSISNIKCYVLDKNLMPLPVGAIGELYIGGVGLARGYLNQPSLTAEKFIANPFLIENEKIQNKNERLYKTGDLVRWLPGGNIEYIGRNDFQVKIRGHRIELGEIETILSNYEGIKQSVILAISKEHINIEDTFQSKYLVGYYVSESRLDEEKILNYLSSRLPEYMVPSVLVYLEKLPVTVNGKLDRKSLPAPEFTGGDKYVAPRNELESHICLILAEVLGLAEDKVGIRDDFFRLGGDSIITIQLVSRLRQRLGLSITIKDVFNYRSIERLYDNVLSKVGHNKYELKTEQGILSGNVSLLPIQGLFFELNLAALNHWNQSFLLKTPSLDIDKLRVSIAKLIEHHDSFRLRYKKSGYSTGDYMQCYDMMAEAEGLKILDVRSFGVKEGSEKFKAKLQEILTNWQSNFDLEKGPTYSIGYIYGYKDGTARIYFALHHLIVDTVSWKIIAEDLKNIYGGKDLGLKGSSYRQWVDTVKEYVSAHESEKSYWANVMSDYDNNAQLNNLVISEDTNNFANFSLSIEHTKQLLQGSNRAYNTQINDILLTALGYALFLVTNSKIHHIVMEGHGREEIDSKIDITRTIGWFTTMYPVRLEISNNFGDSIKDIKENLRQIPSKGIGYGALMGYELNVMPKISFNYLGQIVTMSSYLDSESSWNIVSESSGISIHSLNKDNQIININGMIINNSLRFSIVTKLNGNTTIQIAECFKNKLEEIINHTVSQSRSYLTLSDILDE